MRAALVLGLVVACACAAPTGQGEHAIVGGAVDPGDPAVAAVVIGGAPCTGVLVRSNVVVTAAHCVTGAGTGTVAFGAETIAIDHVWTSRYWTPGDTAHDLALLRLAHDATPAPLPYRSDPVALDGLTVRVVGFGRSSAGDPTTAGVKRQVTLTGAGATLAGSPTASTCTGDSGGAVLADLGAGEELIAIVTAGTPRCDGPTYVTRLGDVAFFAQAVSDLSVCVGSTACPACSLDGACTPDCGEVDLDCPLGAAIGDACVTPRDCESRLCTTPPDDPTVRFCSTTCAHDADCPASLGLCATGRCVFSGGTPGILGAGCASASDCRSGACDTRQDVCVVPCGPGDACPDGFACGPTPSGRACTLPDRSGCSAGGSPGIAVALLIRRRRRSARSAGARAARARPGPALTDPDRRSARGSRARRSRTARRRSR